MVNQYERKQVRYALVSVVALAVNQSVLLAFNSGFGWSAAAANLAAVSAGCVPSYTLNRAWVWRKRGASHLWREVLPFWVMSLIGLALSTVAVTAAESSFGSGLTVTLASLASFGALWVVRYLVLDGVLFGGTTS